MSTPGSARRFHFLKEIASGGFGSVYLAKVMHADGFSRLVAIKLLKSQWSDNEEVIKRTRDEARLLGLLRHRNIVDVLDLTSIDGRTAVVMEFLEGVDFKTVVTRFAETDRRISARAAIEAMAFVASALDAAYNRPPMPGDKPLRVIHRDIKPSNVMIDEAGLVKVLDFGVARSEMVDREGHTRELQFGSVEYMAPERLFFEPETPASDIYSLGATLFEILALERLGKAKGRPERHAAFLADRMSFLRAMTGLSGPGASELEKLLTSALAYENERRPSGAEFYSQARALARNVGGENLVDWAEMHLKELISETANHPRQSDPLTDSVLTEDSIVFDRGGGPIVTGSRPIPGANLGPEMVTNTPLSEVGEQLRRGALAELEESEAIVPAPATGAPSGGRPPLQEVGMGDWDSMTTSHGSDLAEDLAGPKALSADIGALLSPAADEGTEDQTRNFVDMPTTVGRPPPRHVSDSTPLGPPRAPTAPRPPQPPPVAVPPMGTPPQRPPEPRPYPEVEVSKTQELPSRNREPGGMPQLTRSPPPVRPAQAPDEETIRQAPPPAQQAARVPEQPAPRQSTPARPAPPQPARPAPLPQAPTRPSPEPTAPPEHYSYDGFEDEAPSGGLGIFPFVVLGGCGALVLVLAMVGLVFALDVAGIRTMITGAGSPDVVDVPDTPPEQPPEPPPQSGPTITFVSKDANTKKLTVRCTEGEGKGTTDAVVALEKAETCTVTAIQGDRSRLTAVVNKAEAGSYSCFEGGATECKRDK